jgi:hypothetical protein
MRKFTPHGVRLVGNIFLITAILIILFFLVAQVVNIKAMSREQNAGMILRASLDRLHFEQQRRGTVDAFLSSFLLTPPEAAEVKAIILRDTDAIYSEMHVCRQIEIESGGDPQAIGRVGEVGLMQIKPWIARPHLVKIGKTNLLDPATNVEVGIMEVRRLLREFDQNLALALAAYNMGPSPALRYSRAVIGGRQ